MYFPIQHVTVQATQTNLGASGGHAAEHGPAILALFFLPIAVLIFLFAIDFAAREGYPGAPRFMRGYNRLGGAPKLAVLLMLMSATVHLALIPAHSDEPVTAVLFALDAVALVGLSLAAFVVSRWRGPAVALLVANLAAYAYYLLAGLETADPVGVATKLIEAAAIAMLVIRSRGYYVSIVRKSPVHPGLQRP